MIIGINSIIITIIVIIRQFYNILNIRLTTKLALITFSAAHHRAPDFMPKAIDNSRELNYDLTFDPEML